MRLGRIIEVTGLVLCLFCCSYVFGQNLIGKKTFYHCEVDGDTAYTVEFSNPGRKFEVETEKRKFQKNCLVKKAIILKRC